MPDSTDHELADLRQVFVTEAEQHLGGLEEGLLELEARPSDPERLREVFRSMHTIKGSASLLELHAVESLAHRAEDILVVLREEEAPVTAAVITLLLGSVDALRQMVAEVDAGGTPDGVPFEELGRALAAWRLDPEAKAEPVPGSAAQQDPAPPAGHGPAALPERPQAPASAASPAASFTPAVEAPAKRLRDGRRTLRVDLDKLDRLLEATGEIMLARRLFSARLANAPGSGLSSLRVAFEEDDRLVAELHEAVMELRMVPVGPAFRRFTRAARDMASGAGKEVRLVVEGGDVEVDTSIVERLVDPLTHLLRNAIDHGIEAPDVRLAAGKDRAGTVTIRAHRAPSSLVVDVEDDGGGLPRERIIARARERRIAGAERLSETELHDLLFQPGFSTAERVSDLSGRGVGMEVVRRTVEGLRGSVQLASTEGVGTTVSVRVPITLAVVDGLEVQVGEGVYIVPLENVVVCMDAPGSADGREGVLTVDEETVPWVRLRHLFDLPGARPQGEQMLVVRHGGLKAGLVVDRLLGETETMVRPLGPGLRDLPRLGGSAVLRNGHIGLVLDVPVLLRELVAGGAPRPRTTFDPQTLQ